MSDSDNSEPETVKKKASKPKSTIEKTYQKKSQLEHILLRPDTYIGSIEHAQELMWVYDSSKKCMTQRQINYVPGLYKIFDEILVNAADNKQRDKNMNCIRINIDAENNTISVWNNGRGIPVAMHKEENMYVPTMIFGHLLTSSNYDDDEEKVVGGRNGYGAKLCNIFSVKFIVETASSEYKQQFKQVWENNMGKTSEPKLKAYSGEDFTKITFCPDLQKFGMERLDEDIVDLMSRRAYDIAASTRGVVVMLNNEKIGIKSFRDYVDLYVKNETIHGNDKLTVVHEVINERWEIAVTISERGFQQVSFVNSIATTKGGRHVDYVADLIVKQLIELVKKKNRAGITIKPFQIKNHIWVFVNCLIVNPAFDSQTKENMTTQFKKFGSKCDIPDKFIQAFSKSGIVEVVLTWAKFKAQNELAKASGKKTSRLNGIPKLEDANEAGTKNSHKCTLILTEGDSAKCLAVSGLGVVGRDHYGVFPLRGKLLNVREATHKQILENAEINNLIKILGLQHKKKYQTMDDLKTLRYGKIMIMTDQDPDGSHIKGLIINFIHHFWPDLLNLDFLEIFITPIVKAIKKNNEISFYSLQEFEEWKTETADVHTYHIKYYKGLGTSTSKEAKEYFKDMERHRIVLRYTGREDDENILLAFSKKEIEGRKSWLLQHNAEVKRRKELGLPDVYLYTKNTRVVTYSDYVNKELVYYSNGDNIRSIPSMIDGLKPGQRKVLYTCFKRNDKREVKVAQLAGSVAEQSAYHHGEVSLCATIVNLAQNFVGSNNINLLEPRGQFGTRLNGGKDCASPRYIFTKLSPLARLIFHPHDDAILKYEVDDNQKVEPTWYIPIVPMVLINGSDGIGTGWRSKVPNYNPREIVENIRLMLNDQEPMSMKPWFKNFKGTIDECTDQRYVINGEISITDEDEVEITELPVGVWTQVYKENVLLPMLQGSEKQRAVLQDYKEYSTDTTVKFVVKTLPGILTDLERQGLHYVFKLQHILFTSVMNLFDEYGGMKKYETAEDILKDFYNVRLRMYVRRKDYLENQLEAESQRLTYQAKFIVEKCSGAIQVENKKRQVMVQELIKRGYPADPVKAWKERNAKENQEDLLEENLHSQEEEEEEGPKENTVDSRKKDYKKTENDFNNSSDVQKYDYLLGMSMWMLTLEKKNQLLKQRDDKLTELNILREKKPSDLWIEDLNEFLKKLDEIEEKERKDEQEILKKVAVKNKTVNKGRKNIVLKETMPSPVGKRVVPRLSMHILKATKAKETRVKRIQKEKNKSNQSSEGEDDPKRKIKQKLHDSLLKNQEIKDEFDLMIETNKPTLKEKLEKSLIKAGKKPVNRGRKKKNDDGLIQSQLNFSKSSTSTSTNQSKKSNETDKENIANENSAPKSKGNVQKLIKSNKSNKENISSENSDIEIKESTPKVKPKRNIRKLMPTKFLVDEISSSESDSEKLFEDSDEEPVTKAKKKKFFDSDESDVEFIPQKKVRK